MQINYLCFIFRKLYVILIYIMAGGGILNLVAQGKPDVYYTGRSFWLFMFHCSLPENIETHGHLAVKALQIFKY